jgi:hypothetical protein
MPVWECVGVWVSKLIESLFLETLSSQIRFTRSISNFEHIRTVEIEIAIAIGVEFLAFSSISVPIPIWIPIAAAIIRMAAGRRILVSGPLPRCGVITEASTGS